MSINASALNSLQTRINNERSRRSLSPITFTDGSHATGDTIKAVHFNELRTGTEGLNTLGSQTFNWSGNIAVGASITDVTTQIGNFITTLENETLASWHTISPVKTVVHSTTSYYFYQPNVTDKSLIRWKVNSFTNETLNSTAANTHMYWSSEAEKNSVIGGDSMGGYHHVRFLNTGFEFSGGNVTASNQSPWSGGWADYTYEGDQTPYSARLNKGSAWSGNGDENYLYNGGHGVINSKWLSTSYYRAQTGHWYYAKKNVPSSHPYVTIQASGYNNTSNYDEQLEQIVIEVYS